MSEHSEVSDGDSNTMQRKRKRKHWWLLVIPYFWCIAAIPIVNRIDYIWGSVPFLLVWMVAGVLLSCLCVTVVYQIDRRNGDLERI